VSTDFSGGLSVGKSVEQLESRCLFSVGISPTVGADLTQLAGDVASVRSQYQQYTPTLQHDLQALRVSIQAGGALVGRMNAASVRNYAVGRADAFALLATTALGVRQISADLSRIATRPTNSALQARLAADLTAVNARMTAVIQTLGTHGAALGAAAGAALAAVGTAFSGNTSVTDAITAIETDGSALISGVGGSIRAIQSDVSQFLSDVAAGK
jgi:hypothetical protein